MANDKLSLEKYIELAQKEKKALYEVMLADNAKEMDTAPIALEAKMQEMLQVMQESITFGLTGVKSRSGLTGGSAKALAEAMAKPKYQSLLGPVAQDALVYALAVSEANAAMGRIVAAPTAGASGVLPGVLFALKKHRNLSNIDLQKGLIVAGNIGMVIASRASLSGAMGGCQAECGSAAAMAAGATVSMLGGTPEQVGHAVAIVLKNMLGLVCDPVAGLVEVPCIKRNGGSAMQALLAAEMALAGITSFIPADEAIDAMKEVGDKMPCALRETADGGLAHTPTALAWAKKYFSK
jgi:L-serine dehydratase